MDMLNDLYKLCETLGESLKEANEKIRNAGGKLSPSDMQYVNQLTHAIKSVKASIAMMEAEDMDEGGSYDGGGGSYRGRGYSRDVGSYRGGNSYNSGSYDGGSYDGGSYARGRGRNARRDSMGRYSSRGYSRDGGYSGANEIVDELHDLMDRAPDEQTRQKMQKLIQEMEQR